MHENDAIMYIYIIILFESYYFWIISLSYIFHFVLTYYILLFMWANVLRGERNASF